MDNQAVPLQLVESNQVREDPEQGLGLAQIDNGRAPRQLVPQDAEAELQRKVLLRIVGGICGCCCLFLGLVVMAIYGIREFSRGGTLLHCPLPV